MLGLFLTFCVTSLHLYVLVFWTGNCCGFFFGFFFGFLSGFLSGFFSCTLLKILLGQDNSGFNGQMMEFLVHLSHDEGSRSYDLHHMFLHSLYCAFGTGF
jgi:hypothetical protein